MNPIYRFEITAVDWGRQAAFPLWKTDLEKEYSKQSQQEFFRTKMSGKLTFVDADFDFIRTKPIDTEFKLETFISYNGGVSWESYMKGHFWKTDAEFDLDARTCVVTPEADDDYTAILEGIEKEFNLIQLAPEIVPIHYDKRPMLQIYVRNQNVVGCFLSGMWWEQELTEVPENPLNYHFALLATQREFVRTNTQFPLVPETFWGKTPSSTNFTLTNGDFALHFYQSPNYYQQAEILYQGQALWRGSAGWLGFTLNPIPGTIASGTVQMTGREIGVFARLVCDVDSVLGVSTYDIPDNDIVANNRNYHKCVGYSASDAIIFTDRLSSTPTEYGIYQPGQYYQKPLIPLYYGEFYPCARKGWGRLSVWFRPDLMDATIEESGRASAVLNDAYPLGSAISALLAQIAPDITFAETAEYSEFLYGTRNPITMIQQRLFITPKSNVINSGYDQPAQKAPITLKTITDMLRDCFRCFWFVENGKFRIEHISYFMRGGTYTGQAIIGRDLTEEIETRNGKAWSFGTAKFSYDKPEMTSRYQFGWMDDVTQLFEGYPIDILSNFVNKERIEDITVSQFTSDIDYILLNPSQISQDGFVLLAAQLSDDVYKLPYVNFILNYTDHNLQNGYVSFMFLQDYYIYDLPSLNYAINGIQKRAVDIKRQMSQTLNFPCFRDVDVLHLIKTTLGLGAIEKISINLSSRQGKATLKYNAE